MDYKKLIAELRRIRETTDFSTESVQAITEAMDIVFDYENAVSQAANLLLKYETARDVIRRGNGTLDAWQCPACQKFIGYGNEHCHWCGQKIGWDAVTKKRNKMK